MKKNLPERKSESFARKCMLVLFVTALFATGKGQILLDEKFDYPTGNLYGQGEWTRCSTDSAVAVQVIDTSLVYPVYQDEPEGRTIRLRMKEKGEDIQKIFTDEPFTSGTLYVSALIHLKKTGFTIYRHPQNCFLTLIQENPDPETPSGNSTREKGCIFIEETSEKNNYRIGIDWQEENVFYANYQLNLDSTYLIVFKYQTRTEGKRANISLFINPKPGETEPKPFVSREDYKNHEDISQYGIEAIQLKQTNYNPEDSLQMIVGRLKVTKTYKEIFYPPVEEKKKPVISVTPELLDYGKVNIGETYCKTIRIKATDLYENIKIEGMKRGELSVSQSFISKEQAESETGFDLTVSLTPRSELTYTDDIILSSEEMDTLIISPTWTTTEIVNVPDLEALRSQIPDKHTVYRITGKTIINYIVTENDTTTYYVQDEKRGIRIIDAHHTVKKTYRSGDMIKGLYGKLEHSSELFSFIPCDSLGEILSTGNYAEPVEATLSEVRTYPDEYDSRMIRCYVGFANMPAYIYPGAQKKIYFKPEESREIYDRTDTGKLKVFKDADYIDEQVPYIATVTGIAITGPDNFIAPRRSLDITDRGFPIAIETITKEPVSLFASGHTLFIKGEGLLKTEIFTVNGCKIRESRENEIHGIPSGFYLVKITGDQDSFSRKIYIK